MEGKVCSFKDLKIWQDSMKLVVKLYQLTQGLPKDERFGLIDQLRRVSVSVPSNIAEGFRRYNPKEFMQFLRISLGSLGELETQIILCGQLGYLSEEKVTMVSQEIDAISRMTSVLMTKIRNKTIK